MKTFLGSILLFLFLFAQLFGFLYWKQEQLGAKEQASIAKFDSELVKLTFHQAEIKTLDWEQEKEFSFKGNMYDIVSTSTKGDSTVFVCYADEKETCIVHEIEELANELFGKSSHSKKEQNAYNQSTDLFKQDFFTWKDTFFVSSIAEQKYLYHFLYFFERAVHLCLPPQFS